MKSEKKKTFKDSWLKQKNEFETWKRPNQTNLNERYKESQNKLNMKRKENMNDECLRLNKRDRINSTNSTQSYIIMFKMNIH